MPQLSESGFATPNRLPRPLTVGLVFAAIALLAFTASSAGMEPQPLLKGFGELLTTIRSFLTPPEWDAWNSLAKPLEETVEMAVIGTVVALPICFVLALLCARNTSIHPALALVLKGVLAVGRSVPFFCWAMVAVAMAGLGIVPGLIALTISSILYTAKLYAENFETVEPGPIEASLACGAGPVEMRRFGILPQAWSGIASQSLYTFESNIRLSTAMGIVGAGGIGYSFNLAIRNLEYGRILLILICIYTLVFIVDRFSLAIRRRLA